MQRVVQKRRPRLGIVLLASSTTTTNRNNHCCCCAAQGDKVITPTEGRIPSFQGFHHQAEDKQGQEEDPQQMSHGPNYYHWQEQEQVHQEDPVLQWMRH